MRNNFQQIVCSTPLAKIFTHSQVRNHLLETGNHGALMKPNRLTKPLLQLLAIVALASCGHVVDAQTRLPPDVDSYLCTISQHEESPPNNLHALSRDCDFLERAERMFLWVTSQSGRGQYVFRSPIFYDAWSTDSNLRSLRQGDDESPDFIKLNFKNLDVKIDIEPVEPGEVDSKVLMTQDCRLVYYLIQVNDVYAYFLTGVENGAIPATKFPTGQPLQNGKTDIERTVEFARAHNKELGDASALAVELKSAWVETTESEGANYITMKRTIPTYTPDYPMPCSSNSMSWAPNGQKERMLALIGMHVVFSVNGHPEMIWATFEHVNNTPNKEYLYIRSDRHGKKQESDIADHHWMFSNSVPSAAFNEARMHVDKQTGYIVHDQNKTIGPSNIRRNAPWGSPGMDGGDLNTKIIFINEQFIRRLASNDVRKNYIMIGASWTPNGADPSASIGGWGGSNQLVNTTMETFHEMKGLREPGSSTCFECHHGPTMLGDHCMKTGLSHLYGVLPPLFGSDMRGQCPSANRVAR